MYYCHQRCFLPFSVASYKVETESCRTAISSVEATLNSAEEALINAEKRYATTMNQFEETKLDLEASKSQYAETELLLSQARKQVDVVTKDRDELNGLHHDAESQIQLLETEVTTATSALESAREENRELSSQLQLEKAPALEMNTKAESVSQQLERANIEVKDSHILINELKCDLEKQKRKEEEYISRICQDEKSRALEADRNSYSTDLASQLKVCFIGLSMYVFENLKDNDIYNGENNELKFGVTGELIL